ncbi:hypothetical protein ACSLVQ_30685, partial [Klebsiella pneumoniae]|uniref:hypothetical protein n=1 Tax=Klebsiella pneumoniae TaxID=573 RepID=UPI003EE10F05
ILKQLSGQNLISLKNKLYKKNNANTKFQLELLAMCAKVNERYFNSDYYANYLLCSELNKLLIASAEINLL